MHSRFIALLLRLFAPILADRHTCRGKGTIHPSNWAASRAVYGWGLVVLFGLFSLFYGGSAAVAAGDSRGCSQSAPSGWTRTIWWVDGQSWSPGRTGPWPNGTTVSVQESNAAGAPCSSSGSGEAYQDGTPWWGTFRQDYRVVGRGENWEPSYGVKRFNRDTWWDGWRQPAIGGQQVAGYWLKSSGPTDGQKSVFVAGDREVWTQVGSFYVEARCMAPNGPLIDVTFSASSTAGWNASYTGSSWSVRNAAGSSFNVRASRGDWSGSTSLSDGGSYTFVVQGCGSTSGGISLEAHCFSANGPLVNAAAFDAWENNYWSTGGFYGSAGSGSSASFTIPAGASTPIHGRVWWGNGQTSEATGGVGSVLRFVTTDPNLCSSSPPPSQGPNPTPTVPPQPCSGGAGPYDGSYATLSVNRPGVNAKLYNVSEGTLFSKPTPDPVSGIVPPGVPLEVTFDFGTVNGKNYGIDHSGQSAIRWGLTDLTTGQDLVFTETTDEKELKNNRGEVKVWGRTLRLSQVRTTGVSFSGPGTWWRWAKNWSTWDEPTSTPTLNKYYNDRNFGRTVATFTPQLGHRYEAWIVVGHGSCTIGNNIRWSRLTFSAQQVNVTVLEADMSGRTIGPIRNLRTYVASYQPWTGTTQTTDAKGQFTTTFPAHKPLLGFAPGFTDWGSPAMPEYFLWKVDHNCTSGAPNYTDAANNGQLIGFWGIASPCNLTFYYIRKPVINTRVVQQTAQGQQPLSNVPISLVDQQGSPILGVKSDAGGNVTFTTTRDHAVSRVGQTAWRLLAPASVGNLLSFQAIAGTNAQVRSPSDIQLSPISSSTGNVFVYQVPERTLTFRGRVRTTTGQPVGGARVTVTVRNGANTTLDTQTVTTNALGGFTYTKAQLPDDQTLSLVAYLQSWPDPAQSAYQSYPGTVNPGSAGSVARVDIRTLRLTLASKTRDVSSNSNNFELNATPPPAPEEPTLDWKILIHSRYDGTQVYRSEGDQITWPEGEVLNWMPEITLTPAANREINGETYRYEAKIVAWSFVGSTGKAANGPDDFGGTGCRARRQPSASELDGGNAAMLDGCVYYYNPQYSSRLPTVQEMREQVHSFWSMRRPQTMEPWVYVYQLPELRQVDLQVQALVKVQTIQLANPLTGTPEQPVGNPEFRKVVKTTPFYVNLVAPRSTK